MAHTQAGLAGIGPVPERVHASLRGAITPSSLWRIDATHEFRLLKLDCGRFGRGPIHVRFADNLVQTFPKPSRARPSVASAPFPIEDHVVVVYAESADRGDLVTCDVYVDGRSLTNGDLLVNAATRESAAARANSEYVSPFEAVAMAKVVIGNTLWMAPAFGVSRVASIARAHSLLAAGIVSTFYVSLAVIAGLSGLRLLDKSSLVARHRRTAALTVAAACYLFDIVLFGVVAFVAFGPEAVGL